jgi:DNA-binding NarL/FixJ family response regulator
MPTDTSGSAKIRVLLVDDHEDISAVLARCISAEPDMESAGTLNRADELATEVARSRADVVLLDMTMPGRDPLTALRELAAAQGGEPSVRVIAYSGHDDRESIEKARSAGACGYLSKDAEITVLLQAIRDAAAGKAPSGSTTFGR